MKFSYQWIREMVPELETRPIDLERLITIKTAECEGIEEYGTSWNNVVAVRVTGVEALPESKNKRVSISTGSGVDRVVVCGAPNVREGMIAAWVPPGTLLAGKEVRRISIDGVESDGLLASAAELGINRDH